VLTAPDILRSRLDQIVNPAHPLAKLARGIDWSFLEQAGQEGDAANPHV
jgi:O-acetyl-ADP-ribose deacetylase (regulator of RNase III)